ncbi:MAG TPA: hypothetical protein VLL72_08690 [Kiloniellales bacterium]|nr:hypothetical protein [Kiloniellales bacterium]
MPFSDLSTKVEDHAASAIAVMKDRGIRPHPINYTLWYAYFADHCPPLTRELNERLVENRPFTEAYGLEAFERYFGLDREGEQIVETSERVQEALGRVLKALTESGTANSGHGDAIEALSKDLASAGDGSDKVDGLVRAVLAETRKLVANTRAMERRLDASVREVETMRRNLESVRR